MSNVHHLNVAPATPTTKGRRKPYTPKVTAAVIQRTLRVAIANGLTVYGYEVDGDRVRVQTKPTPSTGLTGKAADAEARAEAWLEKNA
jgi:hypothetical protein